METERNILNGNVKILFSWSVADDLFGSHLIRLTRFCACYTICDYESG
jgi:hypothetical protein